MRGEISTAEKTGNAMQLACTARQPPFPALSAPAIAFARKRPFGGADKFSQKIVCICKEKPAGFEFTNTIKKR
jgi:hypothetical protein